MPGSLEEWLRLLRLEEYLGALHQQGMRSVEDVTTLTWEDLEDIGIVRLGHQKKLLLAIKRVRDIRAGKRIQPLDLARLPPHPGHTQVNYFNISYEEFHIIRSTTWCPALWKITLIILSV